MEKLSEYEVVRPDGKVKRTVNAVNIQTAALAMSKREKLTCALRPKI